MGTTKRSGNLKGEIFSCKKKNTDKKWHYFMLELF